MISEELLSMSMKELRQVLGEKQAELSTLWFQKALQQLENPSQIRRARRDIARVKTLLRQMELGHREMRTE